MKLLITGANGFVGRNLIAQLNNIREGKVADTVLHTTCSMSESVGSVASRCGNTSELQLFTCTRKTSEAELESYCREADCVIHLAGVNRSMCEEDFMEGNANFTAHLLDMLRKTHRASENGRQEYPAMPTVIYASSIHALRGDAYGNSKLATEKLIRSFEQETGARCVIYRFTNLFGKWCRPNYNSVIATFCYNIAHELPITIQNKDAELVLIYIDDVVEELIRAIAGQEHVKDGFGYVPENYICTVGKLADMLCEFSELRQKISVPNLADPFTKKLYATYLTYLDEADFRYPLTVHEDARGSFTEIIRTQDRGQFSVNVSRPGITKGNHWHHSKHEKFLVASGHGLIQMRKVGTDAEGKIFPLIEFEVFGNKPEVIEMIPGYTHNIINLSETEDLVTFMWANECFDEKRPDTYAEQV